MRTKSVLEIAAVYCLLLLLGGCSASVVALGKSPAAKMAVMMLLYVVMALIPFGICRMRKLRMAELGYSGRRLGKQLLTALFLFLGLILLMVILPLLAGMDKREVLSFKSSSVGVFVFYIFYDLFFVGFGEEFIFRGYFLTRLTQVTRSGPAGVVLSALLFGFWHFPHSQNLLQVLVTAGMGLVYGFARRRLRDCSVLSLSVAHGLHDTAIQLLSYFLL